MNTVTVSPAAPRVTRTRRKRRAEVCPRAGEEGIGSSRTGSSPSPRVASAGPAATG